jgi:hypothetical protein
VKVETRRPVRIYNLNVYVIKLLCYRLTPLYILHMSKHIGMANTKFKFCVLV